MLNLTLDIKGQAQIVKAKQNACYLRVWLNFELSRRAYLNKAIAQATKLIKALFAITGFI